VEGATNQIQLQPAGRIEQQGGTPATFSCSINFPNTYPTWKINDVVYDSTNLPPGFFAVKSNFSFVFEREAIVQCFFQIFSDGSVVDVCSNVTTVHISRTKRHSPYYPHCHNENLTYSIGNTTAKIYMGIEYNNEDTSYSITFANCIDPGKEVEHHKTALANENSVTFEVNSLLTCCGQEISVAKINNRDNCIQVFSLPCVRPTERKLIEGSGIISDDLSNEHCNFSKGASISYEICVHIQTTNKCYIDTCSEKIRLSWCSDDSQDNKTGLEVDGRTENGTIVSIFCRVEQNNQFVKRMIFNYEIVTSEDGDEIAEYQCNGGNNMTEGEGMKDGPNSGTLFIIMSPVLLLTFILLSIYNCMIVL
jgi:hypothetical protein